jgi:hypothetical protein
LGRRRINMAEAIRLAARPITANPQRKEQPRKDYSAEFASLIGSSRNAGELLEKLSGPFVSESLRSAHLPSIENAIAKGSGEELFAYYRKHSATGNPIINLHGKRTGRLIEETPADRIPDRLSKCATLAAEFPDAADTMPEQIAELQKALGAGFDSLTIQQLREIVAGTIRESPDLCPKSIMRTMKAKARKGDFRHIAPMTLFRDQSTGELMSPSSGRPLEERHAEAGMQGEGARQAQAAMTSPSQAAPESATNDNYAFQERTKPPQIVKESARCAEKGQEAGAAVTEKVVDANREAIRKPAAPRPARAEAPLPARADARHAAPQAPAIKGPPNGQQAASARPEARARPSLPAGRDLPRPDSMAPARVERHDGALPERRSPARPPRPVRAKAAEEEKAPMERRPFRTDGRAGRKPGERLLMPARPEPGKAAAKRRKEGAAGKGARKAPPLRPKRSPERRKTRKAAAERPRKAKPAAGKARMRAKGGAGRGPRAAGPEAARKKRRNGARRPAPAIAKRERRRRGGRASAEGRISLGRKRAKPRAMDAPRRATGGGKRRSMVARRRERRAKEEAEDPPMRRKRARRRATNSF